MKVGSKVVYLGGGRLTPLYYKKDVVYTVDNIEVCNTTGETIISVKEVETPKDYRGVKRLSPVKYFREIEDLSDYTIDEVVAQTEEAANKELEIFEPETIPA